MLGLMYLGAGALYFWLMVFVMRKAWRAGRADGGSVAKASAFALIGFLVVYLPVFWNHIPLVLAQRSMCAKDGGFKALVTPEEWVAANRSRIGELRGVDFDKTTPRRSLSSGFSRYEFSGGLLAREERSDRQPLFGMHLYRSESRLLDAQTGNELTREIGYAVGPQEDARLWLLWYSCPSTPRGAPIPSVEYVIKLKELIK